MSTPGEKVLVIVACLSAPTNVEIIGDGVTLAQLCRRWKDDFELYCSASGVLTFVQKHAFLLHLSSRQVREIVSSCPAKVSGKADGYDKTANCLDEHLKEKNNIPKAW